jgi:hypothetical protein
MTGDPRASAPDTEPTEAGAQRLVPGVRPVTLRDRLDLLARQPMAPRRNPKAEQKPCDHGLFDEAARHQIDLIDLIRAAELGSATHPRTPTEN